MNSIDIALLLKQAREEKELTQTDIAKLLNYSTQTISYYEANKVSPKLDTIFVFANKLNYDPIEFLKGNLVKSNNNIEFNNNQLLAFLEIKIKQDHIKKPQLEKILNVSRPTLNNILYGQIILTVEQYYNLVDYFKFKYDEPFKSKIDLSNSKHKNKKLLFGIGILLICGIVTLTCLLTQIQDNSVSNPNSISDSSSASSPSSSISNSKITINNTLKRLEGFQINKTYQIEVDSNLTTCFLENNYLEILPSWYDKYLSISLIEDNKIIESQTIYIDSINFDNYFNQDITYLKHLEKDEYFETRLNNYLTSSSLELSSFKKTLLEDSLNYDLPYLDDSVFTSNLTNISYSSSSSFNYSKIDNIIWIEGVKDINQVDVYIPSSIENITDIRIKDEAFIYSKNPNLRNVIFETKPTYLGSYIFNGLSLQTLDFGKEDDGSYKMEYKTENESCNSLKGIKYIDKARLPIKDIASDYKFLNILFGKDNLEEKDDSEYRGIGALVLPELINYSSTSISSSAYIKNLKIRSLYIQKDINFTFDYSENLFLRLVQYQKGYYTSSSTKNYKRNSFRKCYALNYVVYQDDTSTSSILDNCFSGCISFKGVIDFENITKLGANCFNGTRLPSIINLKKITSISSSSFTNNLGLNQVHIYKSDSKLTIESNAFINNSNIDKDLQIQKIIFHGFSQDDPYLELKDNYKSDDIQVSYI